jgi:hypothetical protein
MHFVLVFAMATLALTFVVTAVITGRSYPKMTGDPGEKILKSIRTTAILVIPKPARITKIVTSEPRWMTCSDGSGGWTLASVTIHFVSLVPLAKVLSRANGWLRQHGWKGPMLSSSGDATRVGWSKQMVEGSSANLVFVNTMRLDPGVGLGVTSLLVGSATAVGPSGWDCN